MGASMGEGRSGAGAPSGRMSERPSVDETVIEQLAAITDGHGKSVLGELVTAFLVAVPDRLGALDQAVSDADLSAVADQAHALTGSAASFGARGMADLCRELRLTADQGDLQGSGELVGAVQAEFVRVEAWLLDLSAS